MDRSCGPMARTISDVTFGYCERMAGPDGRALLRSVPMRITERLSSRGKRIELGRAKD